NSSVDYYATQGVVMDSIYTRVMAKLTFLEKQLDHVELKQDELTHLPAEKMVELLMDTSLSKMAIDPKMKYQDKYDSILAYYRSNKNLLDSADVNFRQFGASLKNHAGNQKRLNKLVNAIGEKFRDR
ncbi:MAG: hypothetical protein JKY54_05655, partial [Flavobacteriales bacterium]|nr:hypothetical protein [Flavobacteriales bacterium]